MKVIKTIRNITLLGVVLFSYSALAYNPGERDKGCRVAKFNGFNPPKKTKDSPVPEVEAEAKIEFSVSGNADPTTITAVAKDQPLKLEVENKNSFYRVTANLPAVLNGKFVRIHLKSKSQPGDCIAKDGWLIKVKKASAAVELKEE